jgi:hypothetical protein
MFVSSILRPLKEVPCVVIRGLEASTSCLVLQQLSAACIKLLGALVAGEGYHVITTNISANRLLEGNVDMYAYGRNVRG